MMRGDIRKVKSGCRTCKIRKLKCDEGRPACYRCVSTGRFCDGYGVWGGGGNFYSQKQRSTVSQETNIVTLPSVFISILRGSTKEKDYFEWFMCRTAPKLPGVFVSAFWHTLIFQASLTEPAVFHAVLTLSSVHRRDDNYSRVRSDDPPDEQERFMLQHYIKATHIVQTNVSIKDKASIRVTLVACVVFICLEFLLGHFRTAETHLVNGLKVLREMQDSADLDGKDHEALVSTSTHNHVDDWIVEALSRLHAQVLFKHSYHLPNLNWEPSRAELTVSEYHSVNEAWQQLERILNKIFRVIGQSHQKEAARTPSIGCSSALLAQAQDVRVELNKWAHIYESSRRSLREKEAERERIAYQMLFTYHAMANIMINSCERSGDQSVFDSCTERFILIVTQSANLWRIRASDGAQVRVLHGDRMNMSRSIVDVGWIPPLYYTALKCRVHRVRLQAVKLLESTSHREGIWDAKIAARVARKVMEIEETNFYEDAEIDDDFPLLSSPILSELPLPSLPESCRMQEVEVVLPDRPTENVLLFCRYRQANGAWKEIMQEYQVASQCWVNGRAGPKAEV